MPLARLTVGIWIGLFAGYAYADPPTKVCQAIADQANREGPKIAEQNIYDLSDALVAILPDSMRYLTPVRVKSADIYRQLGCDSPADCGDPDGIALEGVLSDDDSDWHTVLVDTRPVSNQVFLFTEHSGRDREDQLALLEQARDGTWHLSPFGFREGDANADDSGFKILRDGKKPYVVVPPGKAFLGDSPGLLSLTVADPSEVSHLSCTIDYELKARLTVSDSSDLYQTEPDVKIRDEVVHFLDRNVPAMAERTEFDKTEGIQITPDETFVEPGTPARELTAVQKMLSPSQATRRDDKMRAVVRLAMSGYWDLIQENMKPEDWEARWFPVGFGGHAYLGLLQGFSGGSFFTGGPHFFDKSLVALFAVKGEDLQRLAVYELQDVFRFSSAEIDKAQ